MASATTPSDEALREEVRAWIAESWSEDLTLREWWRRLAEAGWSQPTWPLGVGGRGLSGAEAHIVADEIGRTGAVAAPIGHLAAPLAAPTILAHGTPEQIKRFVGPIATGEAAWCQLFSEPGSGSDLASVATRAVRDGDEWIISGQKVWNSAADTAQFGMLLARTDVDVPKHKGMSYLLIDMDQDGVETRPLKQMNGASAFCEVFLTEARVPATDMLGEPGDGWRIAQTTLAAERGNLSGRGAAGATQARSGALCGELDLTVGELIARARKRKARRIPGGAIPAKMMFELAREHQVADDPVMRQELARYYIQTRVDSWTLRRSGAARGKLTGADGSMAKLATSRICQVSRDLSFSIVGAAALLDGTDGPLDGELHLVGLTSPGNRLGGGTDEIQHNVLAERGLGLPREPSSDVDVPYRSLRVGTQDPAAR
jgi:alkylation response protein AidB-like acyl-CoA dehydrogenase